MVCAGTGSVDAVSALLVHGADVNARENVRNQTALMWAVSERHSEVVRVLLEHGAMSCSFAHYRGVCSAR